MASIATYLQRIKNAIYGEEVRDSIHDAIEAINDEVEDWTELQDGSVTTSKLANSAVTTAKIADGAVTNVKLASNAVTATKVANGAITREKLNADVVDTTLEVSGAPADAKTTGDEIAELKTKIEYLDDGKDLILYPKIENSYPAADGTFPLDYNMDRSDYIPVTSGETLYFTVTYQSTNNAWYDAEKNIITRFTLFVGDPTTVVVPQNAAYMIIANFKLSYSRESVYRVSNIQKQFNDVGEEITEHDNDISNLYSKTENGYYLKNNVHILRDTGEEATATGESATDFIYVPNNSLVVFSASQALTWGALYDGNKEYIRGFGWSASESVFFDAGDRYFRISGVNAVMATVKIHILPTVDKTLTLNGYPADAKSVGDALSSLDTSTVKIPTYYNSQMTTKETTIRGHYDDCGNAGDGLIFLTDTHFSADLFTSETPTDYFNANNSFSLIKHIINKTGMNKIIFGGDLLNSAPDIDTMLLCMSAFGSKWGDRQRNLMYCVGNHEYFTGADLGQTVKPTPSDLYGAGIKFNENVIISKDNYNTYYFDNTVQKIRYFVISCGRDTELQTAQVKWVMEAFESIPSGYHVILIGHAFMTDAMTGFRGLYANIMAAFDALKAKTTYTYDGETFDYTNTDTVPVCAITGHTHIDGSLVSIGGIPCICTTTDSYALNYDYVDGVPTSSPRTKGTVNEQAFDVMQFDFTNRKVYCTRIGYGSDRVFDY